MSGILFSVMKLGYERCNRLVTYIEIIPYPDMRDQTLLDTLRWTEVPRLLRAADLQCHALQIQCHL